MPAAKGSARTPLRPICQNILFSTRMEKYMATVSGRCVESVLKYSGELKLSWTKLLKQSISVEGGMSSELGVMEIVCLDELEFL